MHAILQHCYFKAPLFHFKTLLLHDSSAGSSESLSDRTISFKIEFKMFFELIGSSWTSKLNFRLYKNLETSVHLSWKVLLTEAKTQFGIRKCNVQNYENSSK